MSVITKLTIMVVYQYCITGSCVFLSLCLYVCRYSFVSWVKCLQLKECSAEAYMRNKLRKRRSASSSPEGLLVL